MLTVPVGASLLPRFELSLASTVVAGESARFDVTDETPEAKSWDGASLSLRPSTVKSRHASAAVMSVSRAELNLALNVEPNFSYSTSTSAVFEACRESRLILSKSGPTQSVLRMVPPMCLSLDDVDEVADGLDRAFSALG